MRHRHRSLTPRFLAASVFGLLVVAALDVALADPPDGHGPRRGPPAEAFAACANLSVGASCTVQLPDRQLQGTCAQFPIDARLVCSPAGMPPGPPPGMPPGQ